MAKERIIHELGEGELLVPELVRRALAANDRVKYLLTLLQTARAAADGAHASDLRAERLASGIEDASLDAVVAASMSSGDQGYLIPRAGVVSSQAFAEVDTMLAALSAAGAPGADGLSDRCAALRAAVSVVGDVVGAADLVRLTGADRTHDSLHLVVVDAHRELNTLAAGIATESISGARAHNLAPDDRPLVAAFMAGLHETEALRFEHPGLATIATRTAAGLVLQNDLGQTDAHVIVIKIAGLAATITYTDVHLERLLFFQQLLSAHGTVWEDTRSRADRSMESGLFHLAVGHFEAPDRQALQAYLRALGSQLVFMIDWNRARKRLRALVGKRMAVELLTWAAHERHSHRAFLLAGGDRLVRDALQVAGRPGAATGASLTDMLGAQGAEAYLRSVLRICSEGLLAGRPLALIQDEARAELVGYVRSAREELLDLIGRHGELVVEICEAGRDALELALAGRSAAALAEHADRARRWEHDADEVVARVRAYVERTSEPGDLLALIEAADDVADSVEDAVFHLTLLREPGPDHEIAVQLRGMFELVLASARAHLRAVTLAADVQRGAAREQMDAFLEAVYTVVTHERQTDDAQRTFHAALVARAPEAADLFVLTQVTRALEEAADALRHTVQLLRDQVLGHAFRAEAPAVRAPAPATPPRGDDVVLPSDVYLLGSGEGAPPGPEAIGAKAYGLARLSRAHLRVPDAVVLTTAVARRDPVDDRGEIAALTRDALTALEARTGLRLGDARDPLVVSVRSGAPVSMPGMLETVLDVGLCDHTVGGLATVTGNPRLAWDCYRRLVESFATVVRGCAEAPFQQAVADRVAAAGVQRPVDLEALELRQLAATHLDLYRQVAGEPFPQDARVQLQEAVLAVLRSWHAPKAREYRRVAGLADDLGTAVLIQRMVFGNAGGRSGSGVGFTRDPALGERRLYVDYVPAAQGEDIVAGRQLLAPEQDGAALDEKLREELEHVCDTLEGELGDAQEFEFTVQDGELFMLQTRTAKRTPWAALRIAVGQVQEGLITPQTALARLEGVDLAAIHRLRVGSTDERTILARATPASPGVASGPLALDVETTARMTADGRSPVLVRPGTATEDIAALTRAAGILTAAGGRTSHAAVVARELGKPCIVGCADLNIDAEARTATIGMRTLAEGDEITLDGESGLVFAGSPPIVEERPTAELAAVAQWRQGVSATAAAAPAACRPGTGP